MEVLYEYEEKCTAGNPAVHQNFEKNNKLSNFKLSGGWDSLTAFFSSLGETSGCAVRIRLKTPVIIGVDMEVPLFMVYPFGVFFRLAMPAPGQRISGFIIHSLVGPLPE